MKKIEVWEHSVEQIGTELARAASIISRLATRANGVADLIHPDPPETQVREAGDLLYECAQVLSLVSDSLWCLNEDVVCEMLKPQP